MSREPAMSRNISALVLSIGSSGFLLAGAGCNSHVPDATLVTSIEFNGINIEYELAPPQNIMVDANSITISTSKAEIRLSDGNLNVSGKSFGSVKTKDKISVLGGRVLINGKDREPDPAAQ
jgi:hypothetical protein